MKKAISTLALAGLGAALAVGAQAQTISSTPVGSYSATFALSTPVPVSAGVYTYTYTVTALSGPQTITEVTFNAVPGYLGGASSLNFGGTVTAPLVPVGSNATISYSSGVLKATSSFTFFDSLPPTALINLGGTASGGATSGTTTTITGPGTAVPEAGSFALLGLGLLPLAFVARRRISSQS